MDEAMVRRYRVARDAYGPGRVRVLLIAESPPASDGFFYFPETMWKEHLLSETIESRHVASSAIAVAGRLNSRVEQGNG